jgi:hypothetical protein
MTVKSSPPSIEAEENGMRSIGSFSGRGPWLVLAGLAVLAAAGCNSKGPFPVRGQLLYEDDGTPVRELADQDITFSSTKLGLEARGTIREDGTFQLGSAKANDGAYPGEYVVTLTQPYPKPERPTTGHRVVDTAYEDPEKSDLRAEVKPGDNNFTFKLRRLKQSR